MRLWRISRFPGLDGTGGLLVSGRWHTRPRPVVYCADHPATALLEVFVHLGVDPEEVPEDYRLLTIEAPDDLAVTRIETTELSPVWPHELDVTRSMGDAWFDAGRTAILDVPSAVAPLARLLVLNTRHPDMRTLRVTQQTSVQFDSRLWKP